MTLIQMAAGMLHSIFSIAAWIELLVGVLAEILHKGEQLITTAFKVRVYTGIAHASTPKVSGRFFFLFD